MPVRVLIAAGLAALSVCAFAQPGPVGSAEFVRVPPVWSAPVSDTIYPWITASAVCRYLKSGGGSRGPGSADLTAIPCSDQPADPSALEARAIAAIATLGKLNEHCRLRPGDCPQLFLAARPTMAGREKVAALSDDHEDRDLDGARRPTHEDRLTGANALSPEARFVEGLTNFVLDRAKLEAIAYFEERFHATLCEGDVAAPRVSYFPAVCNVLSNARGAGFSLASASREMRAAARRDLRGLPDGALEQQYLDTGNTLYVMLRVWLGLAARLRDNTLVPGDVFAALTNVSLDVCTREANWTPTENAAKRAAVIADCGKALQAFAFLGSALDFLVRQKSKKGVTQADLVDATVLAYQARSLSGARPDPEKFPQKFLAAVIALRSLSEDIEQFRAHAEEIQKIAREARDLQGDQRNERLRKLGAELAVLADEMLDLVDASVLAFIGCTPDDCMLDGSEVRKRIADGIRVARHNARLARDVLEDRWLVVAVEISKLYLTREDGKARALVGQYAPVIAEIAGAKTSVEVQKILNEAAAPAGSYREKFRGNTRSISALVGIGVGTEWYESDEVSGSGNFVGLFAPVGIHLTFFKGSLGLFGSLLDLGPYASYRDSESGVDKDSKIGLKQLFSPGVYVTHSISVDSRGSALYDWLNKSPFVVGFGVSRTPSLLQTQSGRDIGSTRVQAFIAIDVTMFPF